MFLDGEKLTAALLFGPAKALDLSGFPLFSYCLTATLGGFYANTVITSNIFRNGHFLYLVSVTFL